MQGKTISIHLKKKSISYAELADAIGTSTSHVHNVVFRKVVSRPIAEKIAIVLDLPFYEVFPEYQRKELAKKARDKRVASLAKLLNS